MLAEAPLPARAGAAVPRRDPGLGGGRRLGAPYRYGPPRVPSPLPHLPTDWRELLVAYLQIVGMGSEDCYGVQVTRADARACSPTTRWRASRRTSAPSRSCRAPTASRAAAAGRREGRRRLPRSRGVPRGPRALARLPATTRCAPGSTTAPACARRSWSPSSRAQSFLSEVFDMFNPLDPMKAFPQLFNRNERPEPRAILRARFPSESARRIGRRRSAAPPTAPPPRRAA